MAQRTYGIFSILSPAPLYSLMQTLVGAKKARRIIVDQYLKPVAGETVLDIGCGPADILDFFPAVNYLGFDLSQAYIDQARKSYAGRGQFYCRNVTEIEPSELPEFDLIMMMSLLHHLDDAEVLKLFTNLRLRLKPTGRLITVDPCRIDHQHAVARFFINHDRGQNIRTLEAYVKLARSCFGKVDAAARNDMLSIPYNHVILSCGIS